MSNYIYSVTAKLGLDASDFNQQVKNAENRAAQMNSRLVSYARRGIIGDNVGKELNEVGKKTESLVGQIERSLPRGLFRHILGPAGAAYAITEFFELAIERAKELRNSTDENVQAVLRFASAATQAKELFADMAVAVVGSLNRVGEGLGQGLTDAEGLDPDLKKKYAAATTDDERTVIVGEQYNREDRSEAINSKDPQNQAEEAKRREDSLKQAQDVEKSIGEEAKRNADERKRNAEEQAKADFENLTLGEKIAAKIREQKAIQFQQIPAAEHAATLAQNRANTLGANPFSFTKDKDGNQVEGMGLAQANKDAADALELVQKLKDAQRAAAAEEVKYRAQADEENKKIFERKDKLVKEGVAIGQKELSIRQQIKDNQASIVDLQEKSKGYSTEASDAQESLNAAKANEISLEAKLTDAIKERARLTAEMAKLNQRSDLLPGLLASEKDVLGHTFGEKNKIPVSGWQKTQIEKAERLEQQAQRLEHKALNERHFGRPGADADEAKALGLASQAQSLRMGAGTKEGLEIDETAKAIDASKEAIVQQLQQVNASLAPASTKSTSTATGTTGPTQQGATN